MNPNKFPKESDIESSAKVVFFHHILNHTWRWPSITLQRRKPIFQKHTRIRVVHMSNAELIKISQPIFKCPRFHQVSDFFPFFFGGQPGPSNPTARCTAMAFAICNACRFSQRRARRAGDADVGPWLDQMISFCQGKSQEVKDILGKWGYPIIKKIYSKSG